MRSIDFVVRFELLSKLDHPRIIKIIDTHLDSEPYWYVMPLYKHSLEDELPRIIGDEARIVQIVSMVLEGMAYAHDQGIIHRDLKPANILMDYDDVIVITDFGLGRDVDSITTRLTYTGDGFGTQGYWAPEQVTDAKRADHLSDIFAMGRIIYVLFTGDPATAIQGLTRLPIGIAAIVEKSTKPDRNLRFQSMTELRTRSFRW